MNDQIEDLLILTIYDPTNVNITQKNYNKKKFSTFRLKKKDRS